MGTFQSLVGSRDQALCLGDAVMTDSELPEGGAFLTAQIAGHEVVYSIVTIQTEHAFSRQVVERRFEYELRPISQVT